MKKLEAIELGHTAKEKKPKTQALMEEILGKIREIESRDVRRETDIIEPFKNSNHKEKNKAPKLGKETKNHKQDSDTNSYSKTSIELTSSTRNEHHHSHHHEDSRRDVKRAEQEIKKLTKLVAKKRPDLAEEEQHKIIGTLFELSSSKEDYKIRDEIAALKILLQNQVFLIESGDPKADTAYTSKLQAEISDLASLL